MLDRLSQESEAQTSDLNARVSASPGRASGTSGSAACSPRTGPTSRTTPTFVTSVMGTVAHALTSEGHDASEDGTGRGTPIITSTSSSEASPARTSASPESGEALTANAQCSPSSSSESLSLFDPVGFSWRTYQDSCLATVDEISHASWTKWGPLATGGPTGFSMLDTSAFRSAGGECSSLPVEPTLASILEPQPDSRYALSGKAAAGILRRAGRRGRSLPPMLEKALKTLADSAE